MASVFLVGKVLLFVYFCEMQSDELKDLNDEGKAVCRKRVIKRIGGLHEDCIMVHPEHPHGQPACKNQSSRDIVVTLYCFTFID